MNQTVKAYFDAFNLGDVDGMLACLSDDVAHHVNEGQIRVGKKKFAEFCAHMNRCYRETLTDMVIFEAQGSTRAAAEYIVNGTYLAPATTPCRALPAALPWRSRARCSATARRGRS